MLCKQLVIPGRALQTINGPPQRKVFITLILPRTGVLCKYSMVLNMGNCQFMSLQLERCSINIPWFYTEEGTVQTGRDYTHNMVFCKYLVILYVEDSEYTPDFTQMKGSSKYSLILLREQKFSVNISRCHILDEDFKAGLDLLHRKVLGKCVKSLWVVGGLANPVLWRKAGDWATVLAMDTIDQNPESPNISNAHKDSWHLKNNYSEI